MYFQFVLFGFLFSLNFSENLTIDSGVILNVSLFERFVYLFVYYYYFLFIL